MQDHIQAIFLKKRSSLCSRCGRKDGGDEVDGANMPIAFATSPENPLGSPNIITLTETSPSVWEFLTI